MQVSMTSLRRLASKARKTSRLRNGADVARSPPRRRSRDPTKAPRRNVVPVVGMLKEDRAMVGRTMKRRPRRMRMVENVVMARDWMVDRGLARGGEA